MFNKLDRNDSSNTDGLRHVWQELAAGIAVDRFLEEYSFPGSEDKGKTLVVM